MRIAAATRIRAAAGLVAAIAAAHTAADRAADRVAAVQVAVVPVAVAADRAAGVRTWMTKFRSEIMDYRRKFMDLNAGPEVRS